jgi:hypothetical protein
MSDSTHRPATLVKTSNIGFMLGVLVVVGLGVYLVKSGFLGKKLTTDPEPVPTASPLAQITEEPITLLDEEPMAVEENQPEAETAEIHQPIDTALGDNLLYLMALLFGSAGITYFVAHKLGN